MREIIFKRAEKRELSENARDSREVRETWQVSDRVRSPTFPCSVLNSDALKRLIFTRKMKHQHSRAFIVSIACTAVSSGGRRNASERYRKSVRDRSIKRWTMPYVRTSPCSTCALDLTSSKVVPLWFNFVI